MTQIKGQRFFTINAIAGETYCISFESGYTVNITNQTDGIITISDCAYYQNNNTVSSCIKLAAQSFINGFNHHSNTLYITAEESGYIVVVRTE